MTLFAAFCPVALAQWEVSGQGGPVPTVDTGSSGNRCDTLPNDFASFPASSAVPENARTIDLIHLSGLSHGWLGDLHAVLRDPNGNGYNLFVRPSPGAANCNAIGDSSDFDGAYSFVPQCDDPERDLFDEANAAGGSGVVPSGIYGQDYGDWIDGADGVRNKDISGIEVIPGIWTLEIYDGTGGATGSLSEWFMGGSTDLESAAAVGGVFPIAETGDSGNKCDTLPNDLNSFSLFNAIVAGGTIESVVLEDLTHARCGDVHVVLESPTGAAYNLIVPLSDESACNVVGDDSDFGDDYTIVSTGAPGDDLAAAAAMAGPGEAIPGGTYRQDFGAWIDGSAGVFNTPLDQIPVEAGVWSLVMHDGRTGETGTLSGWRLVVSRPSTVVCEAEGNSTGVAANFTISGSNSIAVDDLTLHVDGLPTDSFGFFLVGDECVSVPALGGGLGTLCVGGDLRRGFGNAILNSGASGTVSIAGDLANVPTTGFPIPSGVAATPYQRLFLQYWYRDLVQGVPTSNLSNARLVVPTM